MGAVGHAYKSANRPGCPVNLKCESGVQVDRSERGRLTGSLSHATCGGAPRAGFFFFLFLNDVPLNERYLGQRPG